MKTLLILRHARSRLKEDGVPDADRPLEDRGDRDASKMGRLLVREGIVPDVILASTALRARRTAMHIVEACGFEGSLYLRDELYLAPAGIVLDVLCDLPDRCVSVTVIGHNPGLENLLDTLTGADETLSAAALARIALPVESWKDLDTGTDGQLVSLWRPDQVADEDG